jgi:hypothetical protein
VLSFVTASTRSIEGKSIADYTSPLAALTTNAGVVGWVTAAACELADRTRFGDWSPTLPGVLHRYE